MAFGNAVIRRTRVHSTGRVNPYARPQWWRGGQTSSLLITALLCNGTRDDLHVARARRADLLSLALVETAAGARIMISFDQCDMFKAAMLSMISVSYLFSVFKMCAALITADRQRCAANPFTEESDRRDKEASRDII